MFSPASNDMPNLANDPLGPKVALLAAQFRAHAPLLVAYSGGVDSAYLLAEASRILGDAALGVIADSPSPPEAGARPMP